MVYCFQHLLFQHHKARQVVLTHKFLKIYLPDLQKQQLDSTFDTSIMNIADYIQQYQADLHKSVGLTEEMIPSLDKILVKYESLIDKYVDEKNFTEGDLCIPLTMIKEITDLIDLQYAEQNIVLRTLIWSTIITSLQNRSFKRIIRKRADIASEELGIKEDLERIYGRRS